MVIGKTVIPPTFFACLALMGLAALMLGCRPSAPSKSPRTVPRDWTRPDLWTTHQGERSSATLRPESDGGRETLRIDYVMPEESHGYVEFIHALREPIDPDLTPVVFQLKARGTGALEVKFIDRDGSVFGRKLPLGGEFKTWTRVVMDMSCVEYWWGGEDATFGGLAKLMLVPSGQGGKGSLWVSAIGPAAGPEPPTLPPAGPQLDPDRDLPGLGPRQRREAQLTPEDPLVLEWMKHIQDSTTSDQCLLGTLEDTNLQTFNNALAAMAFMVKGERERAERILNFFSAATDRNNAEPFRQNFFYHGEARGFFQNAHPVERDGKVLYYADDQSDRWMGDMVWLMFAYLHYDNLYGAGRYDEIERLIIDLVISWYRESPDGAGGYVQHGWRKGDVRLHEEEGHHEGNIDCYALFRTMGKVDLARKIRIWLDHHLHGNALPLDLYTWRALAYAPEGAELLDVPDSDFRFRKTVEFNGRKVVGVYHSADLMISNVWVDGVGHMACAYFAVGNRERGNFYANQFDAMIIDRNPGGRKLRAVPYVLNSQGGFANMDIGAGSLSPAAWYLFAKNRFNPMLQTTAE